MIQALATLRVITAEKGLLFERYDSGDLSSGAGIHESRFADLPENLTLDLTQDTSQEM